MALEWVVLGYVVGAEAILLLLVTMPGLESLRKGLIMVARNALTPLMAIVPFSLFLFLDIYWKYENMTRCEGEACTVAEQTRLAKSIMKSQRNGILVIAAIFLYWILYVVTRLLVRVEKLNNDIKLLKKRNSD